MIFSAAPEAGTCVSLPLEQTQGQAVEGEGAWDLPGTQGGGGLPRT